MVVPISVPSCAQSEAEPPSCHTMRHALSLPTMRSVPWSNSGAPASVTSARQALPRPGVVLWRVFSAHPPSNSFHPTSHSSPLLASNPLSRTAGR